MSISQVKSVKGKYPHIEFLDIEQNGQLRECAILRRDDYGNVFFFPIASLDRIDKKRLADLLRHPNVNLIPLWDLMSQQTLGNGMNALEYFHQLTRVLTINGRTMSVPEFSNTIQMPIDYTSEFGGVSDVGQVQQAAASVASQVRRGGRTAG